jgi:hypothetical protein
LVILLASFALWIWKPSAEFTVIATIFLVVTAFYTIIRDEVRAWFRKPEFEVEPFSITDGTWEQHKLEPGKDVRVSSDRIRVSTTRADKAVITAAMPCEAATIIGTPRVCSMRAGDL